MSDNPEAYEGEAAIATAIRSLDAMYLSLENCRKATDDLQGRWPGLFDDVIEGVQELKGSLVKVDGVLRWPEPGWPEQVPGTGDHERP